MSLHSSSDQKYDMFLQNNLNQWLLINNRDNLYIKELISQPIVHLVSVIVQMYC